VTLDGLNPDFEDFVRDSSTSMPPAAAACAGATVVVGSGLASSSRVPAAQGDCTEIVVDVDTSLPAGARPIDLAGVPGL
jgi:hypothetical protein